MRLLPITAALLLAIAVHAAPTKSASDAEAQLGRVESRIRAVTEAVQSDVAARDAIVGELRSADQALAAARARFDAVHGRHVDSAAHLAALRAEQLRARAGVSAARQALAIQLRATYVAGRDEALKVLLDSGEPARIARLLAYYGYLGRARTAEIVGFEQRAVELQTAESAVSAETQKLAGLETDRKREATELVAARRDRARVMAKLQSRIASRSVELQELKSNAAALEDLLKRLRVALAEPGGDDFGALGQGRRPFPELHGKLPWPARGVLAAHYGEPRVGGLTWNGLLLDTHRGGEVRAPYYGRVAYADWLPGLGLLLILDHGGGWMSLYGYNGRLLKKVGERVKPGEAIAESVSDAEAGKPQLYFEIRETARAINPRTFLKGAPAP